MTLDEFKDLSAYLESLLSDEQREKLKEPTKKSGTTNTTSTDKDPDWQKSVDEANAIDVREVYRWLGGDPTPGKAECPICKHQDRSVVVGGDVNCFKCHHGKCKGKGGDKGFFPIALVCRMRGQEPRGQAYVQALRDLAAQFGTTPPPERKKKSPKSKSERAATSEAMALAAPGSIEAITHCEPGRFKNTDLGNAERLVNLFGRDIRYVPAWKKWLVWDERRWRVDDQKRIDSLAQITVRSIYLEAQAESDPDKRGVIATHAIRSEAAARKAALLEHATSLPGIVVMPGQLDVDPWLFNVANGTIELKTGKLHEHRREDLLTKISPVAFDPDAKCPTFDRFMASSQPDEAIRNFVLRLDGYALTGVVEDHIFPIFYGKGRNGKGVHERIIAHVMGDYGARIPTELLMARKLDAHPTEKTTLFGVRFAYASEPEEGGILNVALVKALTGDDSITARGMRENFWSFDPVHKIQFSTNHKPRIKETKDAIWDRVVLVPWTQRFTGAAQDKRLKDKLKREASGVLNHLVRACLDWQANGLQVPAAVQAEGEIYREENDVLGRWLAECCELGSGLEVKSRDLYTAYKDWCRDTGQQHWTETAFGLALGERGLESADGPRKAYRIRRGVTLRAAAKEARLQADIDARLDALIEGVADGVAASGGTHRGEAATKPSAPSAIASENVNHSKECGGCGGCGATNRIDADLNPHVEPMPLGPPHPPHPPQTPTVPEALVPVELAPEPGPATTTETRSILGATRYSATRVILHWSDGRWTRYYDLTGDVAVSVLATLPPMPTAPMGQLIGYPHTRWSVARTIEFTLAGSRVVGATVVGVAVDAVLN